jgi:hypothetical protein
MLKIFIRQMRITLDKIDTELALKDLKITAQKLEIDYLRRHMTKEDEAKADEALKNIRFEKEAS